MHHSIAFLEERGCVEKIVRMKDALVSAFSFLHLSSPITTKASKIRFSAETGLSETLLGPG